MLPSRIPTPPVLFFALAAFFFGNLTLTHADTVKLKDGTVYEGKITLETADLIKIEVSVTERIKETKTVAMSEVAEVIKTAADDARFAEIQKLVPTGSMLTAEQYQTMIRTGPEDFLRNFSGSKHRDRVQTIMATLEEELDKVERGFLKLEGEWYSPQDRIDYEKLIESRIALLRMKQSSSRGRYLDLIAAMRNFENLEENYFGTPAFAEAAALARQILPNLGRQIQALRRDVDVKNQQWEENKNALDLQSRQRVEAARAREEAQFAAAVAADKKAKIKWTRVNPRSPENLDQYIQFVAGELSRIRGYDIEALKELGEALVVADKLLAQGELEKADAQLEEASELSVGQSSGSRSSSRSKGSSTYLGALNAKLKDKVDARKAAEKAAEEAQKSEALAAELKGSQSASSGDLDLSTETAEPAMEDAENPVAAEEKTEEPVDAFAALATNTPKTETKKDAVPEKKPKSSQREERDREERYSPPPANTGGGIPINIIIPILTVLVIGTVVVLKVLGIGDKKKSDG